MRKILLILFPVFLFAQGYIGYSTYTGFTNTSKCTKYLGNDEYTIANWIFDTNYHTDLTEDIKGDHTLTASAGFDWTVQDTMDAPFCNGKALYFADAQNFTIPQADAGDFNMGTNDFTIEGWIETIDVVDATRYIVQKRYNDGFQVTLSHANTFYAALDDGPTYLYTTFSYTAGETFYFAVTYDRDGYLKLYKNGVLKASKDISSMNTYDMNNTVDFTIGSNRNSSVFLLNGLSQVRISNKARTATEIQSYYNSTQ